MNFPSFLALYLDLMDGCLQKSQQGVTTNANQMWGGEQSSPSPGYGEVWIPQSSQQTIRKVHLTAKKVHFMVWFTD